MGEILEILEFQISRTEGKVLVDDLPHLEVDPMPIRLLFTNLLGNALKFHKEKVRQIKSIQMSNLIHCKQFQREQDL